jgi:predicted PurR-regulated permease PerM
MTHRYAEQPFLDLVDRVLRLGAIVVLLALCIRILRPFLFLIVWSILIAVIAEPAHRALAARLKNRTGNAALILASIGIVCLLAPIYFIGESAAGLATDMASSLDLRTIVIPAAPDWVVALPLVGAKVGRFWNENAANLPAVIPKLAPYLQQIGLFVLNLAKSITGALATTLLAIIAAALILGATKDPAMFAARIFMRLSGDPARGERFAQLAAATVRSVVQGVVGVTLIQSTLVGVGFFAIGLPAAGFLTFAAFLLGVMQIPLALLTLPVVAYVLSDGVTTSGVIFAAWAIIAGLSDNILRPLLMGRGLEVPMPVILIGVIGGMLADGMMGLFVGPVFMGLEYVLFKDWMSAQDAAFPHRAISDSAEI